MERVLAKIAERGDCVVVLREGVTADLVQGVVSGRTGGRGKLQVYVAIDRTKEVVVPGATHVYAVRRVDGPSGRSPGGPPTSGTPPSGKKGSRKAWGSTPPSATKDDTGRGDNKPVKTPAGKKRKGNSKQAEQRKKLTSTVPLTEYEVGLRAPRVPSE